MLDTLLQDFRYAARSLRRTPGFTATAVITLALGIAANSAIFSVFDAVLLRPLPYRDADRLVVIHEIGSTSTRIPANALHFDQWRASTRSFEQMALIGPAFYDLRGTGDPVRVNGARISPALFDMLGVRPALGRVFREDEDATGRDAVVMLGHELWRRHFQADPAIIGRALVVDDEPHTVVGVLPEGFRLPKLSHFYALEVQFDRPEIWKPFAATDRDLRPLNSFNYVALAKLRPGVSMAQAVDELNVVQAEIARNAPEPARFSAALVPMADQIVSRADRALQLVFAAVVLVLLIACVNITNLLLARGGRRHREFAIRRATGAHHGRLIRQLLVETLVLSSLAGVLGVIAGNALVHGIRLTAPIDIPRIDEAAFDWRVLAFAFVVTVGSGLLIGFFPAWRAARTDAGELLRASSTTAGTSRATGGLRSVLVSVEVAASAVCLVAAALLLSSFVALSSVERGFDEDRILTVDFTLVEPRYERDEALRFLATLTERVRALPGVASAGVIDMLPLSGTSSSAIMVEGTDLPRPERPWAMIRFADRGYFETLGIRLLAGRLLDDADEGVAVISIGAARRLWPQQDPIGKRFRHGPDDSPWVEVVGVVNDVRAVSLTDDPPLSIYTPVGDYFYGLAALAVKTTSDPAAVAPALHTLLREMDPELIVSAPRAMNDLVAEALAQPRFQMGLIVLLAAAAAFLAGLGVYGVVSQGVVQRTGEFGLRMALGAVPGSILRLVVGRAMLPVVMGLAFGLMAAAGAGRLLEALLFGISPTAVLPFVGAGLFLAIVALAASAIPAYRAARVNPLVALRNE